MPRACGAARGGLINGPAWKCGRCSGIRSYLRVSLLRKGPSSGLREALVGQLEDDEVLTPQFIAQSGPTPRTGFGRQRRRGS